MLSLLVHARDEDGEPMSDEEIRDQLRLLVAAGYETTAISLAWALHALHQPDSRVVLDRLLAELDALGPEPDPAQLHKLPRCGWRYRRLVSVGHGQVRLPAPPGRELEGMGFGVDWQSNQDFQGLLDAWWVIDGARSADWARAQYLTGLGAFVNYGDVEDYMP